MIERQPSRASVWALRYALFFASLLVVTGALHRIFSMPTPAALNLFAVALAGAATTILIGVVAMVQVWRYGKRGSSSAIGAIGIALTMLAWPLAMVPDLVTLPPIHDISTDLVNPPAFVRAAALRPRGSNAATYPGAATAEMQKTAYPDIGPLFIQRPVEESFELAAEALRRQRIKVINESISADGASGAIEAVDRTLLLGFNDDLVIRLTALGDRTRVDLRSASQFGRHDLGRNAERVRRVLKAIVARVQATIPATAADRVAKARQRAGGKRILEKSDPVDAKVVSTRSKTRSRRRKSRARE